MDGPPPNRDSVFLFSPLGKQRRGLLPNRKRGPTCWIGQSPSSPAPCPRSGRQDNPGLHFQDSPEVGRLTVEEEGRETEQLFEIHRRQYHSLGTTSLSPTHRVIQRSVVTPAFPPKCHQLLNYGPGDDY